MMRIWTYIIHPFIFVLLILLIYGLDTLQFKRVFNQERANRSFYRPNSLDDQSKGLIDNSNDSVISCANLIKTINEKKNLCEKTNTKKIVEDISFDIKKGEILGIIGPSGAGKSTIFKILTMMETRDSGEVFLGGISIDKEDGQYAAAEELDIGLVFQEDVLWEEKTVDQNLKLVGEFSGLIGE